MTWVEEDIPISTDLCGGTIRYWDHMYETIREGKAFPVNLAEALKVIEVIDKVKSGTIYAGK